MRTLSVTLTTASQLGGEIRISTEVIVEEGAEEVAGREAAEALTRFIAGFASSEM